MTTLLVKSIHTLVTMDAARREIKDGALFIRDGVIEAVGTEADMPAERADRQIRTAQSRRHPRLGQHPSSHVPEPDARHRAGA